MYVEINKVYWNENSFEIRKLIIMANFEVSDVHIFQLETILLYEFNWNTPN